MAAGQSQSSVEQQFCWEQVARTHRPFRLSRVFADPASAPGLLPLYALFSSVEQVCCTISDVDVAGRKLQWWYEEWRRGPERSNHPVMKELHRTGTAARLPAESFERLLAEAQRRLDPVAPHDLGELREISLGVGLPQLEMELGASGMECRRENEMSGLAAQNGLAQLIREGRFWWVPLDLLARHGLQRDAIAADTGTPPVRSLFGDVFDEASLWGRDQIRTKEKGAGSSSPSRHVLALNGIYARKLQRLRRQAPTDWTAEMNRTRFSDLLTAWNAARKSGWPG